MRPSLHPALVPLLTVTLASPLPAGAQAPPPAPEPAAPAASSGRVAGSWTGWARLTNDWPALVCRYEGSTEAASVRLELKAEGGTLRGSVAIDLPAEEGSPCPPLRKRSVIGEAALAEGALTFTDSAGHEWHLALRRGGEVLQGILAWRQGGPENPLAEGFALPDGTKPGSRLSGEVRLERVKEEAAPAASPGGTAAAPGASGAAPVAPRPKVGVGGHLSHVGLVLGANAVALGLLYGVNKVGKGSSEGGTITCSPRFCIVGAPGEPCFCEGNVLSGAPCGETPGGVGVPIGGACDSTTLPCQAGLSCNNNLCEDRSGQCSY